MQAKQRLLSLDVFRGITMFLLVAEAARVYEALTEWVPGQGPAHTLVLQFEHHPWNGLRFWDLIQPFFMFIVGVAMPFSLRARLADGTRAEAWRHILYRCLMLFLFGTGLHCVYAHKMVWELWNVLTQLSFTVLVTFAVINRPWRFQLTLSLLLLILTEILYRMHNAQAPYLQDGNFGDYMDLILMGKLNDGQWVAINCIPTAAHTIWGAMCGNLLLGSLGSSRKIRILLIAGLAGLLVGYGLDGLGVTPIIKRIATTSFVFSSGGWALLALAFFYWLVDLRGNQGWIRPFSIVGMNSIFIYLFTQTVGSQWVFDAVKIFNDGILGSAGLHETTLMVTNSLLTLGVFWYLCYWLHSHRIYIKI